MTNEKNGELWEDVVKGNEEVEKQKVEKSGSKKCFFFVFEFRQHLNMSKPFGSLFFFHSQHFHSFNSINFFIL